MNFSLFRRGLAAVLVFLNLIIAVGSTLPSIAEAQSAGLNIPITAKEINGTGTNNFPMTVVIPLPRGKYFNTNNFRVVNANGTSIPAGISIFQTDWHRDNSIRSVEVVFPVSLSAFTGAGTGQASYYFRDDGPAAAPAQPITVSETGSDITVTTGPARFRMKKTNFNLFDAVWLDADKDGTFSASEQIISSSSFGGGVMAAMPENQGGALQYDSARSDVTLTIEDQNPMFAVLKFESLTKFNSLSDHKHGYAVRLYFYAGQPFVKVDYQTQNSPIPVNNRSDYAALPFQSWVLNILPTFSNPTKVSIGKGDGTVFTQDVGSGVQLRQTHHSSYSITNPSGGVLTTGSKSNGVMRVSDGTRGITAFIRDPWQKYPMGLSVDDKNKISVEFYPAWAGYYSLLPTQNPVYTAWYAFDNGTFSNDELVKLAKTWQYPPVGVLPTSWYTQAGNMDYGHIFSDVSAPDMVKTDIRIPDYNTIYESTADQKYGKVFNTDVNRRTQGGGGGMRAKANQFAISGDPRHYYDSDSVSSELLLRSGNPIGYDFSRDGVSAHLELTGTGYGRDHEIYAFNTAPQLKGVGNYAQVQVRDHEHRWNEVAQDASNYMRNRWITSDYNKYILEFLMSSLVPPSDPRSAGYPGPASRARGHDLTEAGSALKTVANWEYLNHFEEWAKKTIVDNNRGTFGYTGANPYNEDVGSANSMYSAPEDPANGDAVFQAGYLANGFLSILDVVDPRSSIGERLLGMVYGLTFWNYHRANWAYYISIGDIGSGDGDGSSATFVDPQSAVYWLTGEAGLWTDAMSFVNGNPTGILQTDLNGPRPEKPYEGSGPGFRGGTLGEAYFFVKNYINQRDPNPAPSITDLKATTNGGAVTLSWTTPNDSRIKDFFVYWHELPFTFNPAPDRTKKKWFAGHPVSTKNLNPRPGEQQSITFTPGVNGTVYAVVVANTAVHPLGGRALGFSNIAATNGAVVAPAPDTQAPSVPANLTASAVSSSQINLSWDASTDNTAVTSYRVFRNGAQIGTPVGTTFADTGLQAGTSYAYTVRAVDGAGNVSGQSNSVSATTQAAPAPIPTPPPTQTLQGDANGDGIVNSIDYSYLLSKFGSDDAAADVNDDGIVNSIDVSVVLTNFGKTT